MLALGSNTLTPNDVTPAPTEEELQQIQSQERALLASMMGLVSDPVGHFNHPVVETPFTAEAAGAAPAMAKHPIETPFTAEVFHEDSSAPITSGIRTEVEEPRTRKLAMPLAAVVVLVLAVLGTLLWRSRSTVTSGGPVKAIETKIPNLTASNPESKGAGQSGVSPISATQTSISKPRNEKAPKPKDQSVAPQPPSKALPATPATKVDNAAPRPPVTIPKNVPTAKKEEAPPNGAAGVPGSVPGGVPNTAINIAKDIPVAEAKLTAPPVPQPKSPPQKVRVLPGWHKVC